jgi:hypothetical protein
MKLYCLGKKKNRFAERNKNASPKEERRKKEIKKIKCQMSNEK